MVMSTYIFEGGYEYSEVAVLPRFCCSYVIFLVIFLVHLELGGKGCLIGGKEPPTRWSHPRDDKGKSWPLDRAALGSWPIVGGKGYQRGGAALDSQ